MNIVEATLELNNHVGNALMIINGEVPVVVYKGDITMIGSVYSINTQLSISQLTSKAWQVY